MDFLEAWQKKNLPLLRQKIFKPSRYEGDVTIVIYAFPREGTERRLFDGIECAILQTWKILGLMKTVLVVSHEFKEAVDFAGEWDCVELRVAPDVVPGDINTMSVDCIKNLHSYFSTPYCLVIQNDGFPLQDKLGDFLGKYDYVGAPTVRDSRRWFLLLLGLCQFNGGFSLRSHKICRNLSRDWSCFWRFFIPKDSRSFISEDGFYTQTAKLNPLYRLRHKFPSEKAAFRFAYDELAGLVSRPVETPFGFHGHQTAACYLQI